MSNRLFRHRPWLTPVGVVLLVACGSSAPEPVPRPPQPRISAEVRPPLSGYPLALRPELQATIEAAFGQLSEGDLELARSAAQGLLDDDPTLHPATVLLAQVALERDDPARVVELVEPVAEELPGYLAAEILLARAYEDLGDVLGAYGVHRKLAAVEQSSRRRAEELRPRALEIAYLRLEDDLARGRLEDAQATLERLLLWDPDGDWTLEGQRQIAAAQGDLGAELEVVRRLLARDPENRDLEQRLAELEVETGEIGAGLERFEALSARYPEDQELREQAERAKFLWRVQRLPPEVQALSSEPALSRADYSALLVWLAPQVRFAALENPPIASDILDHPRREEIVRVLNMGLLSIDRARHSFGPEQQVRRRDALLSLIRLMAMAPQEVACVAETRSFQRLSNHLICVTAARCGLIAEAADCLPQAAVSGQEMLELFRRSLAPLGSP